MTIPKTAFKKGEKRPNQGKRGPNKQTKELKEMILSALDKSGGVDYLVRQAEEKPVAFLALVSKVLPLQIAGDAENPVNAVVRIERVIVDAKSQN